MEGIGAVVSVTQWNARNKVMEMQNFIRMTGMRG